MAIKLLSETTPIWVCSIEKTNFSPKVQFIEFGDLPFKSRLPYDKSDLDGWLAPAEITEEEKLISFPNDSSKILVVGAEVFGQGGTKRITYWWDYAVLLQD